MWSLERANRNKQNPRYHNKMIIKKTKDLNNLSRSVWKHLNANFDVFKNAFNIIIRVLLSVKYETVKYIFYNQWSFQTIAWNLLKYISFYLNLLFGDFCLLYLF